MPPRVPVTPAMLNAYALMKGEPDNVLSKEVLHQALYFNPQRGVPDFRAWLPGLSKGEFDIDE